MLGRLLVMFLLCVMASTLSSCATTYKAHDAVSIAPEEVAYLVPLNKFGYYVFVVKTQQVLVSKVDGKDIKALLNPNMIELLPGEHILTVAYSETTTMGNSTRSVFSEDKPIIINVEKGHTYALEPVLITKDDKQTWDPVLKDMTGQKGDPRLKKQRTTKIAHEGALSVSPAK